MNNRAFWQGIIAFSVFLAFFITTLQQGLCASQHGQQNTKFFLLRKDANTISLNSFENEAIKEIASYSASSKALSDTDGRKNVAIFEPDLAEIKIFTIDNTDSKTEKLSDEADYHCILVYQDSVFIGGGNNHGTKLVRLGLLKNDWSTLENPIRGRKAIDDLIVDGDNLIAIDNVVFPKYVLYYKLDEKGQATFSHQTFLRYISGNEEVKFGRISGPHIGVFSKTNAFGFKRDHITIYDKKDFRATTYTISAERVRFNDFLISGENLIIATEKDGVIRLNFKQTPDNPRSKEICNVYVFDGFQLDLGEKEMPISLVEIPGSSKLIVSIVNADGEFRHEVISEKTTELKVSAGKLGITPIKSPNRVVVRPPKPLKIFLKGIIGSGENLTALIEDKDGNSFNVKKNENVEKLGIKIVDIMNDRIVIFSAKEKKRRTFMLEN